MGQTSQPYIDRTKDLLGKADGGTGPQYEMAVARAQVNATLAVAAELHDLNVTLKSIHSSGVANGVASLTQEQRP